VTPRGEVWSARRRRARRGALRSAGTPAAASCELRRHEEGPEKQPILTCALLIASQRLLIGTGVLAWSVIDCGGARAGIVRTGFPVGSPQDKFLAAVAAAPFRRAGFVSTLP
jgi:hypothetical protein